MKAQRENRCITLLFNLGARWVGGQRRAPTALPPGMNELVPTVHEVG